MTGWQTPKPLPVPLAMSSPAAGPSATEEERQAATATEMLTATASPLPVSAAKSAAEEDYRVQASKDKHSNIPTPKLRFEVRDLEHEGAARFLKEIRAGSAIQDAVKTVLHILYDCTGKMIDCPAIRSITLILRPMDGVAYTTGNELDFQHKEIHVSLDYINGQDANRFRHETLGVLVHEMVHVWQWNALHGDLPGGLIEGIADYVRLKAGFAPPHWKRDPPENWDAGYDKTAFFLEWLEDVYGAGKIIELNGKLKKVSYDEKKIWKSVFGREVGDLFKAYCDEWKKRKDLTKEEQHQR